MAREKISHAWRAKAPAPRDSVPGQWALGQPGSPGPSASCQVVSGQVWSPVAGLRGLGSRPRS
eukprot:436987-Pyramimonas_sp.AAC.1